MRRAAGWILTLMLLAPTGPAVADPHAPPGVFSAWTKATFARAKQERRIIVLMVSTSWCHWCHVMKRTTYGDAAVQMELKARFLPILVDADDRPDLAERFRQYRWPATAFLTPDAEPVLAFRGHRGVKAFRSILGRVRSLVAKGGPYPGFDEPWKGADERVSADRAGLERLRRLMRAELDRHYDNAQAGWGRPQKYPVPEPLEYGLLLRRLEGRRGADFDRSIATLAAMESLIDREWGGIYQYSLRGRWDQWHPEKIMSVSAGALGAYADAYARTQDRRWLKNAKDIVRWLDRFMQAPGGGYYGTQDADAPRMAGEKLYRLRAKERERYGIPRVNPHVYAKDNGEAALALLRLHAATGDTQYREKARRSLEAVLRDARHPSGGVRHELGAPSERLYLADQVAIGRALVAMSQADDPPREAIWIGHANRVAKAMEAELAAPDGGYFDVARDTAASGVFAKRIKSFEPNAVAARFLLELARWDGSAELEARARRTIVAIATARTIPQHGRYGAGMLIAVEHALRPWALVKVVGDSGDPERAKLEAVARRVATAHPLVTWQTSFKPGMAAHVLVCGPGYCSDPVTSAAKLPFVVQSVLQGESVPSDGAGR